jgi:hypothetical protein
MSLQALSGPIVEVTRHHLERLLDGWRPVPASARSTPRVAMERSRAAADEAAA